ncbi:MAG: radical SAM protein [Deltaproteobacteria bacterium]|nr:radical SAM protein [Deltaproteobacteria bacterium]
MIDNHNREINYLRISITDRCNLRCVFSSLKKVEGLRDISLTTNGILLEDYAEEIFDAGIKRINVSLDSLSPDRYRDITRGGDISRVIRGISKAHDTGFSPIKINVVAIKGFNDNEIIDFAKLTIDKPYQIRFIEFMPVGNSAMENSMGYLSNDEVLKGINSFSPLEPVVPTRRDRTDGPACLYTMKDAMGKQFLQQTTPDGRRAPQGMSPLGRTDGGS